MSTESEQGENEARPRTASRSLAARVQRLPTMRAVGDARAPADGRAPGKSYVQDDARRAPRHVYVHVPFCRAKCDYCEFYSVSLDGAGAGVGRRLWRAVGRRSRDGSRSDDRALALVVERFIAAVHAEWASEGARHGVRRLETVYVGGGTPSLLGEEGLERLLEPFQPLLTPKAEVTVEVNPEDVTSAFAAWAAARRLRVSLGVQSFQARLREALGRRAAADPGAAFRQLRTAGVGNLSIDLIFAIPGQTRADLEADLDDVARLRPDHVSWYELGVAEGTPLGRRLSSRGDDGSEAPDRDVAPAGVPSGGSDASPPPGDGGGVADAAIAEDGGDEAYRFLVAALRHLGYRWYEVSSFARAGFSCRHNLAYWRGRSYVGLGPSAVSTVGDVRWRNAADVTSYVSGGVIAREEERLDPITVARERLFLASRIGGAVPLAEIAPALADTALAPLAAHGYISLRGGKLTVARKGRYVANEVCVRLFRD